MSKRLERDELILLISSSCLLSSVLFLFAPVQLYIANISELWFSFVDILGVSLASFALATLIIFLIGLAIRRISLKAFYVYAALSCGLGTAFYIQGNYIPFEYGILNGSSIDWAAYSHLVYISTAMWIVCLCAPIIYILFRRSCKILTYISIGLILVQSVALLGMVLVEAFPQNTASNSYISEKGLYEVSEEENVVIFVLDSFDSEYIDEIYNSSPEYLDFLDGFTCFTNMVGSYPNTKGALPYILTRQYYKNEVPYLEYIETAWEESAEYYQELVNKKYDINVYSSMEVAFSEKAKASLIQNAISEKLRPSNPFQFEKAILQFAAMRFFPDGIKKYIWEYEDLFENLKSSNKESDHPFVWEGKAFYEKIKSQGLTLQKGKKYSVIHLDGTHTPFTYLEDLSEDPSNATALTEAKANLNILREFIKQLKDLNVYDKTCMIITADHGGLAHLRSPIFLMKGFNNSGDLVFSDKPISHSNLFASVLSEIGVDDYSKYGVSVFDDGGNAEDRLFYQYTVLDSYEKTYLPDLTEYIVKPAGNTEKNFVPTGMIYTSKGATNYIPYEYNIGNLILFDNAQSISYFVDGISDIEDHEEGFIRAEGYSGQLRLHVEDNTEDLLCHIDLHDWMPNGSQRVLIKMNEKLLYDATVTSQRPYINFAIPASERNGDLISFDFEYPDACTPDSIGLKGDFRVLSVAFKSICLEKQETVKNISFLADGNAEKYFYEGFYWTGEHGGCWTDEKASIIAAIAGNTAQNMIINYESNPAAGETHLYYNGVDIGVLPHHAKFETERIVLPVQHGSNSNAQLITFITDDATTYSGLVYEDTRILGIHVSEISFAEQP